VSEIWQAMSEAKMRHGMTNSRVWLVWKGMLDRCRYTGNASYRNYGGCGIKVCESWHTFENFYFDMGYPPTGTQLDRIDPDGDYAPENCRWISVSQNANNRRNCNRLTLDGRTMTITQWARELGLSATALRLRINKHKWPLRKALTTPPRRRAV